MSGLGRGAHFRFPPFPDIESVGFETDSQPPRRAVAADRRVIVMAACTLDKDTSNSRVTRPCQTNRRYAAVR
jgi:hypothetical protein